MKFELEKRGNKVGGNIPQLLAWLFHAIRNNIRVSSYDVANNRDDLLNGLQVTTFGKSFTLCYVTITNYVNIDRTTQPLTEIEETTNKTYDLKENFERE